MSSSISVFFETPLGRFILGIILLAIAPLIVVLIAPINVPNTEVDIGGTNVTVPAGTIWGVMKAFIPVLIVITGLYYLGVRL